MKKKLLLILIFLIAAFFRLYQLGRVPPSPSLDEVSIGWNAYSLLTTGEDEYGSRWPLLLRAYNDWRPALYVYFVIPFIKLFGLSTWVVRLPAVLLSLVTILTVFFLVKELFKKDRYAFMVAFLLAVSPWHIYLSRLGHEVGAGLTLSVLSVLFFLKGVKRQKRNLIFFLLSALFMALSFYTYQSQKIFGPLLMISLVLIFRQELLRFKKELVLAGLLGLLLVIPILRVSLSPEGLMRFQGTSIFNQPDELQQLALSRTARNYQEGNLLGRIFDNRWLARGITFLRGYLAHFNPSWLFLNEGKESHKIPGLGVLYLWELPFLLMGAYQLVKGKFSREAKLLLFSWLMIAFLPAGLTTQAPHAMRAFNLLPVPQVMMAIGLVWCFPRLKRGLFLEVGGVLLFFSLVYLCHNYFINFPQEQSESFQYPLSQAINYVLEIEDQYSKIVFSNQDDCYQSYMFFLFNKQYPPYLYLAQGGTGSGGFAKTHAFDKYEFRPIEWEKEVKDQNYLYIGNVNDFPEGNVSQQEFSLLNNEKAILIVK